MRLFFAIGLPPDIVSAIAELQSELRSGLHAPGLRWTKPESIHLTLKFIGESKPALVPAYSRAAETAVNGITRLNLQVTGLGAFPADSKPRVLWLGVAEPKGELVRLAAALDRALVDTGVPREKRPFSPHLTLARVGRRATDDIGSALQRLFAEREVGPIGAFQAKALTLFESQLRPEGARYRSIGEWPLAHA